MFKLFSDIKPTTNQTDTLHNVSQTSAKFYAMHMERVDSLKELIKLPLPNECTFLWSMKSFNAFTFIPFLIKPFGVIDELHLSTYTINKRIVDALVREIDAKHITDVQIFISDSIKFRMPSVIDHLSAMMQTRPNIAVTYGWNHSKVTCARCGDNYFVMEGSGNWGENAQYEQYVLINSQQIYEFRKTNFKMV